jgi:SAM-dependent methyltransferase
MQSKVLDVACGPGWTSHFLVKLGHQVYGLDIAPDLIEIARKRIASEPFQVYEGYPLSAHFYVHDIEEEPLNIDTLCVAAFFESALHHFYNPIQALRNVSANLQEDGIICIWEGRAPDPGTPSFEHYMDLMKRYHTLERPYTKQQLIDLLDICGFHHYEFFSQINGLFNSEEQSDMDRLNHQLATQNHCNVVIASRNSDFFEGRLHNIK